MLKSIFLLILSLSLIAIGVIKAISLSQVSGANSHEEAPTLQTGVLTEKQKRHSKLYKEYRSDQKIPQLAAEIDFDSGITIGTGLPKPVIETKSAATALFVYCLPNSHWCIGAVTFQFL